MSAQHETSAPPAMPPELEELQNSARTLLVGLAIFFAILGVALRRRSTRSNQADSDS